MQDLKSASSKLNLMHDELMRELACMYMFIYRHQAFTVIFFLMYNTLCIWHSLEIEWHCNPTNIHNEMKVIEETRDTNVTQLQ